MPSLHQIEPIFHEALQLPESTDRAAWLARRCGNDPQVMAEVWSLLAAHSAMATQPEPAQTSPEPAIPNEQFGVYRPVRLVGRGGMSAVYLAERVDGQFDKRVAVKVMGAHLAGRIFCGASTRRLSFWLRWNTPTSRRCWMADYRPPAILIWWWSMWKARPWIVIRMPASWE
jgi:hypothetical protein